MIQSAGGCQRTHRINRWAVAFLTLQGLGCLVSWGVLCLRPEVRQCFTATDAPDATLMALAVPDLLRFATGSLAAAWGLATRAVWAWPVLCMHAGAEALNVRHGFAWHGFAWHGSWGWYPKLVDNQMQFAKSMAAFNPLGRHITVLQGLEHPQCVSAGGHSTADSFLTGSNPAAAVKNPSPDQIASMTHGHKTRYPSLVPGNEGGLGGEGRSNTLYYNQFGRGAERARLPISRPGVSPT
jgi:hypothetical protein